MSKLDNTLRENSLLKEELERLIHIVKENETKHRGFMVIQYSFLLSNTLEEMSNKSLKYIEDIFNIDKAVIFIKKSYYKLPEDVRCDGRIYWADDEAFSYTFLDQRIAAHGNDPNILHPRFRVFTSKEGYSFAFIPILEDKIITGALGFFSKDKERFSKEYKFDFITELAFAAGIALKKISDVCEMGTNMRAVLEIPDKKMLESTANYWFNNYKKTRIPYAFLFVDLHNFRQVNDVFDYTVGDDVLKKFIEKIELILDSDDLIGRFSGDKFYIFVCMSDRNHLMSICENILKVTNEIADELKLEQRLSACGGGVRIPEDFDNPESITDIVKLADKRLYNMKLLSKSRPESTVKNRFSGITNDR